MSSDASSLNVLVLVHFDKKHGHVSISLLGHNVQVGFKWVIGHNIFFYGCPYIDHIGNLGFGYLCSRGA